MPHSTKAHVSTVIAPFEARRRSRQNTRPVQIVTDDSRMVEVMPATIMLCMPKIVSQAQPTIRGTATRCQGRQVNPRESCQAAASSSSALSPVMTWWMNSQNMSRLTRKADIADSRNT